LGRSTLAVLGSRRYPLVWLAVVPISLWALRNWAAAALAGAALAVLLLAVLPRAFGSGEEPPRGATSLTVLSVNVHGSSADPAALVALVDRLRPDVLAVQELAGPFDRALRRAGLERRLPYSVLQLPVPGEPKRRPGIGTYSDLPLRRLPGGVSSSSRVEATLPGGRSLKLVDFHSLRPLSDPSGLSDSLAGLPSAGAGTPWLVAGDFNATLDQAELRAVLDRGYRDAADAVGMGLEPTWPANQIVPALITIDHVLVDRRLGISGFGLADLRGTDHRAIYARIFLRP
jgi:endonuclease/exonuclease/phosphatase (EEP) superfamily protein YafD